MEFDSNRPIYLQIADAICEKILSGEWKGEDRIPSVREYGAQIGVNPNTVARSYDVLTADGAIYNKRGIGFFVCPDAAVNIRRAEKARFLKEDMPAFVRRAGLLGISPEELKKLF